MAACTWATRRDMAWISTRSWPHASRIRPNSCLSPGWKTARCGTGDNGGTMMSDTPSSPSAASRLSLASLPALPASVARPHYIPGDTRTGFVHFGPGAFHRAHQAAFIDDLLAAHSHWAICAVSLHSAGVRDALRPQDGLYTLATLGKPGGLRVIGAIREVLCAPEEPRTVPARVRAEEPTR